MTIIFHCLNLSHYVHLWWEENKLQTILYHQLSTAQAFMFGVEIITFLSTVNLAMNLIKNLKKK